jgi:hypothetical protein
MMEAAVKGKFKKIDLKLKLYYYEKIINNSAAYRFNAWNAKCPTIAGRIIGSSCKSISGFNESSPFRIT